MAQDLQTIFDKYKYDRTIETKSKTWFQQQALLLSRTRINDKRLFSEQKTTTRMIPGNLYMFIYDPKMKETLPYYDTFPLIFPYAVTKEGFMGLNMHYLPYFQRIQLMSRLMQFATNKNYDENTRIKYSWSLIAGASKFAVAANCIKHYLASHVRSPFIEIPATQWHTCMMLPVERFVGANKKTVWGDSIRL